MVIFDSKYIIAKHLKKNKQQEIVFPFDYDPNTEELIKTNLGNGVINEMTINIDTRKVSATLLYAIDS